MAETYEERMARRSRIHYLENDSDFARTSVEEFETWKGQLDLPQNDKTKWRERRIFQDKYFQSLVDAFKDGQIKSANIFLGLLCKAATDKDHARLGRAVMEAFANKPLPSRLTVVPYLRSYVHFLKWLKGQWNGKLKGTPLQNEIKSDIEKFSGQKISGSTLEDLLKPGTNNSK